MEAKPYLCSLNSSPGKRMTQKRVLNPENTNPEMVQKAFGKAVDLLKFSMNFSWESICTDFTI